jgi:hypothetical protein
MEYQAWIKPENYSYIFNAMHPGYDPHPACPDGAGASGAEGTAADFRATPVTPPAEYIVIRGIASHQGGGRLLPFYRIRPTPTAVRLSTNAPTAGSYEVRFLNQLNTIVDRVAWTPGFQTSSNAPLTNGFTWILPAPTATVHQVQLLTNNTVLVSLPVSSTGPVLTNLQILPLAGPASSNRVLLTWQASTNLSATAPTPAHWRHQVYYSYDSGLSWHLIRTGLSSPEAEIDLSRLPGGSQCQFEVATTDGFNASRAKGPFFPNALKSPRLEIVTPRSQSDHLEGGGVLLTGAGYNPQTGGLPGTGFNWHSDVQGPLGTGSRLVVRDLAPGTHRITLRGPTFLGNIVESDPVTVNILPR